jgi:hypothetical protein
VHVHHGKPRPLDGVPLEVDPGDAARVRSAAALTPVPVDDAVLDRIVVWLKAPEEVAVIVLPETLPVVSVAALDSIPSVTAPVALTLPVVSAARPRRVTAPLAAVAEATVIAVMPISAISPAPVTEILAVAALPVAVKPVAARPAMEPAVSASPVALMAPEVAVNASCPAAFIKVPDVLMLPEEVPAVRLIPPAAPPATNSAATEPVMPPVPSWPALSRILPPTVVMAPY